MELIIKTQIDYTAYYEKTAFERLKVEEFIAAEMLSKSQPVNYLIGYCEACNLATKFGLDWSYHSGTLPNYRERLVCQHCGLNNRQRFMAGFIAKEMKRKSIGDIYMFEQVTSFFSHMVNRYNGINVIGSEYLGYGRKSGEIVNGIRHEDALNMSFSDRSIDLIISNDVFEHVPDIGRTAKEVCRVVKDGGKLLFTVPFCANESKTKQRAVLRDGKIMHVLPERYHGNPVSKEGSLVFYDFGWDILDIFSEAGFKDTYMIAFYSMMFGHIGESLQYMFIAEK
jgi:hypothetical protein